MLNQLLRLHKREDVDFVIKLVAGLLLTCTLGPITVKVRGGVPITLQTLQLLLVAIAFGWRIGGLNAFLYVLFGLAGLPVFAGYVGGFEQLNSAFGGFFFGFVAASLVTGILAEQPLASKALPHFFIWVAGHALILGMGAFWLRSMNPEGWQEMVMAALPGAMVKSAVGFLLLQVAQRFLLGRKGFYR
jgi:biotin transport system substrate-specific component